MTTLQHTGYFGNMLQALRKLECLRNTRLIFSLLFVFLNFDAKLAMRWELGNIRIVENGLLGGEARSLHSTENTDGIYNYRRWRVRVRRVERVSFWAWRVFSCSLKGDSSWRRKRRIMWRHGILIGNWRLSLSPIIWKRVLTMPENSMSEILSFRVQAY